MHDRSVLGAADVTDHQLREMVAAQLSPDTACEVDLLDSAAEVVDYALPALTTAGRFWVRGHARVSGDRVPFTFFVKHVQSWARSPLFAGVPPQLQEWAEASVPWRTEPLIYRSDLAARLPVGLSMPRVFGVYDLDDRSASVWLGEVLWTHETWQLQRYSQAAHLLGRLAASPSVAGLARIASHPGTVRDYLDGRLRYMVLPALHNDATWEHPLVSGAFDDDLRRRLLTLADNCEALVEELASMPHLTGHGDACPNNLMVQEGVDHFVLIDYGFWGVHPVGFDLGQLLVGEIQIGRRPAADMADLERSVLPAYLAGLHAEGSGISGDVVRRAHALQVAIFTALSTIPFEHLGQDPTPELAQLAGERATIARFSLDLLDDTNRVTDCQK